MFRRQFLKNSVLFPAFALDPALADAKLLVTDLRIHEVKVNQRGNWHFVELITNKGLTGLGEASHGFSAAVKDGGNQLRTELATLFQLVKGESPFAVEQYRQRGF